MSTTPKQTATDRLYPLLQMSKDPRVEVNNFAARDARPWSTRRKSVRYPTTVFRSCVSGLLNAIKGHRSEENFE